MDKFTEVACTFKFVSSGLDIITYGTVKNIVDGINKVLTIDEYNILGADELGDIRSIIIENV